MNSEAYDEIVKAAAQTFYADAWVMEAVEQGLVSEEMAWDRVPPVPPFPQAVGRIFVQRIQQLNRDDFAEGMDLGEWFEMNYPNDDPEDFGYYLAMESLGHGVAWSDSHEDHVLDVPEVQLYIADPNDTSDDNFTYEMDERFMRSKGY